MMLRSYAGVQVTNVLENNPRRVAIENKRNYQKLNQADKFSTAVQYVGADLNEQDALRLQLQTHAVAAVIQEVLQPQKLEATQSSPVPPVHSHLQLPGLVGSKHQVKHIPSGPVRKNANTNS